MNEEPNTVEYHNWPKEQEQLITNEARALTELLPKISKLRRTAKTETELLMIEKIHNVLVKESDELWKLIEGGLIGPSKPMFPIQEQP